MSSAVRQPRPEERQGLDALLALELTRSVERRRSEAIGYLKEQLEHDAETNRWARYWGLEGLVNRQSGGNESDRQGHRRTQRGSAGHDPGKNDPRLARRPCDARDVKQALEQESRWRRDSRPARGAARGNDRRSHPTRSIDDINDDMYDAIVALGAVSPESSSTDSACHALIERVKLCRLHPWWDAWRSKALAALGCLRFRRRAGPGRGVVGQQPVRRFRGGARARADSRHVRRDRAHRRGGRSRGFAGRRAIRGRAPMDEPPAGRPGVGRAHDVPAPTKRSRWRPCFFARSAGRRRSTNYGHARTRLAGTRSDGGGRKGIRDTFDSVLQEARSGYRVATYMDAATFLLGVGMLGLGAYLILSGKETLGGFAGTGGALGVIYSLFFANPRTRVQGAVQHLMTMKIIFLATCASSIKPIRRSSGGTSRKGPSTPPRWRRTRSSSRRRCATRIAQVREPSARAPASEPEAETRVPIRQGRSESGHRAPFEPAGEPAEPPSRSAKIAADVGKPGATCAKRLG